MTSSATGSSTATITPSSTASLTPVTNAWTAYNVSFYLGFNQPPSFFVDNSGSEYFDGFEWVPGLNGFEVIWRIRLGVACFFDLSYADVTVDAVLAQDGSVTQAAAGPVPTIVSTPAPSGAGLTSQACQPYDYWNLGPGVRRLADAYHHQQQQQDQSMMRQLQGSNAPLTRLAVLIFFPERPGSGQRARHVRDFLLDMQSRPQGGNVTGLKTAMENSATHLALGMMNGYQPVDDFRPIISDVGVVAGPVASFSITSSPTATATPTSSSTLSPVASVGNWVPLNVTFSQTWYLPLSYVSDDGVIRRLRAGTACFLDVGVPYATTFALAIRNASTGALIFQPASGIETSQPSAFSTSCYDRRQLALETKGASDSTGSSLRSARRLYITTVGVDVQMSLWLPEAEGSGDTADLARQRLLDLQAASPITGNEAAEFENTLARFGFQEALRSLNNGQPVSYRPVSFQFTGITAGPPKSSSRTPTPTATSSSSYTGIISGLRAWLRLDDVQGVGVGSCVDQWPALGPQASLLVASHDAGAPCPVLSSSGDVYLG